MISEVYAFGTQAAGRTGFVSNHVSECAMLDTADILFSKLGSSNICCIPFEDCMMKRSADGAVPVLAFASMPGGNPTAGVRTFLHEQTLDQSTENLESLCVAVAMPHSRVTGPSKKWLPG